MDPSRSRKPHHFREISVPCDGHQEQQPQQLCFRKYENKAWNLLRDPQEVRDTIDVGHLFRKAAKIEWKQPKKKTCVSPQRLEELQS